MITIYALVNHGELQDIGQTKNLTQRLEQRRRPCEGWVFDDVIILASDLEPGTEACVVEREMRILHDLPVPDKGVGWHSTAGTIGGQNGRGKPKPGAGDPNASSRQSTFMKEDWVINRDVHLAQLAAARARITRRVLPDPSIGGKTGGRVSMSKRRKCSCGRVSTPAGIGYHQKWSDCEGWTDL